MTRTRARRSQNRRLVATGLRIGEVLAAAWDALDLDAGTVEVRATVSMKSTSAGTSRRPRLGRREVRPEPAYLENRQRPSRFPLLRHGETSRAGWQSAASWRAAKDMI